MLKISVIVSLLIAGITATENCDGPPPCPMENAPSAFPESEEEFKDVCNFAIPLLECIIKHEEKCSPDGTASRRSSGHLSAFRDICDEDTLLYAAIAENIKCFSAMYQEGYFMECGTESAASASQYIESLRENGILALTDDETEIHTERACMLELVAMACLGLKIEQKCGTVAMDTHVEIIEKFYPSSPCAENMPQIFPEIVRMYKLNQEQASEIVNDILKKRK